MTVAWGDYEPYDPGVFGPRRDLPPPEARAAFDRLMEAKEERIEALRQLLERNGIVLGSTDAPVQDVNDWFRREVEPDSQKPGRMALDWYPVVNDLGLFLGEVMIERRPELHWAFYSWGKTDVNYQRPVIMGFTDTVIPKYTVDPARLVATYGHRIVAGNEVEDHAFLVWIRGRQP